MNEIDQAESAGLTSRFLNIAVIMAHCKKVLIRYNTESDGKSLLWRLLLDGKEHLVNSISIEVPCFTSTDWLEEKQVFKHHISVGDCEVTIDERLHALIK
jgi:hypothetical protein